MRIAVVGAGVSGLVTAHLLDPGHQVTVLEAAGSAGGHTNTVRGHAQRDAPRRHRIHRFNDRNYPNFQRLLERLRVASQPSTMTFGVSDGHGDFEYTGSSPNGPFAKRAHMATPWFHRMVADMARLTAPPASWCVRVAQLSGHRPVGSDPPAHPAALVRPVLQPAADLEPCCQLSDI